MGCKHGTLAGAFVGASAAADHSRGVGIDAWEPVPCTGRCSGGPGRPAEACAGDACRELGDTPAFRGHGTLASQLACSPGVGNCSSRDRAGTPPSGGTSPAIRVGPSSFACGSTTCSCRDDSWG